MLYFYQQGKCNIIVQFSPLCLEPLIDLLKGIMWPHFNISSF